MLQLFLDCSLEVWLWPLELMNPKWLLDFLYSTKGVERLMVPTMESNYIVYWFSQKDFAFSVWRDTWFDEPSYSSGHYSNYTRLNKEVVEGGRKKKEHASVHTSTLASGSYLSRASGPTTFDILGIKVKVPLTQKSMFSLCIRFMSKVKLKMCICKWFKQHFNKVIQT